MKPKSSARDRILSVAAELFHRHGYKEVGINEIIEKSKTAKATFYTNFKSKEKLGEAWLNRIHDASEKSREKLIDAETPALQILTKYFRDLEKHLKNNHYRGCPYTNTAAVLSDEETSLIAQVHQHKDSVRKFFRQLTKREFSSTKKANQLGDRLFLLYSGATTESQNLQQLWPVKAALETCKDLWQNALDGESS